MSLQHSYTCLTKQFVAPNKRAIYDKIEIPQFEEPIETDAFTMTVLELIRILQLGDYNNVFEAKRCLAGGKLLPPNFNHPDIIIELRNFGYESVENVIQLPLTLTKLKRLLDMLKFVFNCDEWHHTMETLNEHDLRHDKDLKFLVYSNEFLNSLQPEENQQGSSSDSQDGNSSVQA